MQTSITRLADPYTSQCISSWETTDFMDYVPTDEAGTIKTGWGYSLPVRSESHC